MKVHFDGIKLEIVNLLYNFVADSNLLYNFVAVIPKFKMATKHLNGNFRDIN